MKKILLSTIAALSIATTAFAADATKPQEQQEKDKKQEVVAQNPEEANKEQNGKKSH